jgi:hypothetical protein
MLTATSLFSIKQELRGAMAVNNTELVTSSCGFRTCIPSILLKYYHWHLRKYCHAFSDRRRVLDWQLDLLQSYTQVQYNWVSPDSFSLTTHDSLSDSTHSLSQLNWVYHNNSAAIVTAATLVTGELQVPFLPFPGHRPTNSTLDTNSLQLNSTTHSPTTPTHNWELRGIWLLVGL